MVNVAKDINEFYGYCARCGKKTLAYDPEMLKPLTVQQVIEMKKNERPIPSFRPPQARNEKRNLKNPDKNTK